MLELVPKIEKPKRHPRGFYEPLVKECLDLIAAGKADSIPKAAWLTCRRHPDEGVNILTLENYVRLARRFRVEPSFEAVTHGNKPTLTGATT